ncbi:MAG TPA: Spy/CpxP family protein refolding chaperone [Pyrinomonadaceae bacterium]|nr:Spy/CpxP family protein refolding chaperone [Pyrinomonadaceae bacterium]
MKKFSRFKMLALVSLSSIVLVASVAFAQTTVTTQDNKEKARGEWRGRGKRDGHRDGFRGGRGGFGGGAMFRQLNLTEDQKTKMAQIRESFGERTKSLRQQLRAKHQELRQAESSGTFNEALATQKLSEEAVLKAKLMGEQHKLQQEMLTVLTSEQRTQMEQLRAQFKNKRGEFKRNRGERSATPNQ